MKFATMATGGIGGYLAVRLTQAGHEVATIARGAHLDAIRDDGLKLFKDGKTEIVHPWIATDDPKQVGPVDAILFGVKGDALETAARACIPMLGPDTIVVPFLNGVEASDRLCTVLPEHHVANGVAQVSTTITQPGLITQVGEFARFIFAERNSRASPRVDALRAAINGAGASAPETDDIDVDLWFKFVMFSGLSGVTAAGRCTVGDIARHPELGALFRAVIAETAALGRARGVALPDGLEAEIWGRIAGMPPMMRASTAIDVEHHRPLEIHWVSGAVSRLAKAAGLEAPMNSALYGLLLPHKDGQ